MPKKLCDLKKLLKTDYDAFLQFIQDPTHVCKSCGRVANEKRRLCKPQKLKPR